MPSKMLLARARSALRSAWSSRYGQVSFSFFGKAAIRKTGNLLLRPDIHNPSPTAFPPSLAVRPGLPKSACSPNDVSHSGISRNQCNDRPRLLRAKELVGNREVK